MTCSGCESRKGWIRRWLGIDDILQRQGKNFRRYIDDSINKQNASTNAKIEQLMGAGAELESAIMQLDKATAYSLEVGFKGNKELEERLNAIRDMIRENRQGSSKIRSMIKDLDSEVSELSTSVQKLEFPGFEPIGNFDPEVKIEPEG